MSGDFDYEKWFKKHGETLLVSGTVPTYVEELNEVVNVSIGFSVDDLYKAFETKMLALLKEDNREK